MIGHKVNFIKENGFKSEFFLLLDWLPYQGKRTLPTLGMPEVLATQPKFLNPAGCYLQMFLATSVGLWPIEPVKTMFPIQTTVHNVSVH